MRLGTRKAGDESVAAVGGAWKDSLDEGHRSGGAQQARLGVAHERVILSEAKKTINRRDFRRLQ